MVRVLEGFSEVADVEKFEVLGGYGGRRGMPTGTYGDGRGNTTVQDLRNFEKNAKTVSGTLSAIGVFAPGTGALKAGAVVGLAGLGAGKLADWGESQ